MWFSFDSNLGIRIGTIGIAAKNHKVITVKGQTAVPLQRCIPRTVLSSLAILVTVRYENPLQG